MPSKLLTSIYLSLNTILVFGLVACQPSNNANKETIASSALRQGIVRSEFDRFILQALATKPQIGTRYWIFSNVKCKGCFNVLANVEQFYRVGDVLNVETRVAHYLPKGQPLHPAV
jgi:hypothetical protein